MCGGGVLRGGERPGGGPSHQVLDAGQRLLQRHGGVRGAGLLGQLQHGHVAQRAHLPHLQPLNEAPERKREPAGENAAAARICLMTLVRLIIPASTRRLRPALMNV